MATHNAEVVDRSPAQKTGTSLWGCQLSTKTVVAVIGATVALIASPFAGKPWGWTPSYGGSYGDTVHSFVWVKEEKISSTTQVNVGDNVAYFHNGHGAMKRVWYTSPDHQWFWVMGDNLGGEGESGGSCEIGWICRLGATSQSPTWPEPNLEMAPERPITARAVIVDFWSPFDRRSEFEKKTRFFHDPDSYVVSGPILVLVGKSVSRAYDRDTGTLKWEIPGKVTQVQGQIAKFLKPSAFICDPIPGEFDLATGKATLAPEPKIADPKLRSAKLVETSGQNPVKVFDDDPMTVWYIGDGCRRVETLTIRLPKPVTIKSVRVDGRYSYGTQLTVSASLNGKKLPVSSDFNVNRKVDTIVLTLIQRCRQPVTGQVKEVDIIG